MNSTIFADNSRFKTTCNISYKLIILDEADALTEEAQHALLRIVEVNSGITRFCFICNNLTKLIDPLKSRCVILRFAPIKSNVMIREIKNICKKENMHMNDNAIKYLVSLCNGDMRTAITYIQTINVLHKNERINVDDVQSITEVILLFIIFLHLHTMSIL